MKNDVYLTLWQRLVDSIIFKIFVVSVLNDLIAIAFNQLLKLLVIFWMFSTKSCFYH